MEEQPQPSQPNPVSPTSPPTHSKSFLIPAVLVLVVMFLAAGSYLFMNREKSTTLQPSPVPSAPVTQTATEEGQPLFDTAVLTQAAAAPVMLIPDDWATYTDDVAKFSFRYPNENTKVTESKQGEKVMISSCFQTCLPTMEVSIYKDYDGESRREWLKTKRGVPLNNEMTFEEFTLPGINGLFVFDNNSGGSHTSFAIIPKEGTVYLFSFPQSGATSESVTNIKQIVSSFKYL